MAEVISESYQRILQKSLPLFAKKGFDGVSMRDIAREVGLKAPALYNHFADKQELYLKVIAFSFEDKTGSLIKRLNLISDPLERLENLLSSLTRMMLEDENFRHLIQRELLDGDDSRLHYLGNVVFSELYLTSKNIFKDLCPAMKAPGLMAITAMGMIRQHIDLKPLYPYLPDDLPDTINPESLTKHVIQILLHGIKGNSL